MGVAALLVGLVAIIVILGFVTSLQNRFSKPGRGRKRNLHPFEDESDAEEKHSPRHYKKSTRHHHENEPAQHRQHENSTVQQQVSIHHRDHSGFSEGHSHPHDA